MPSTSVAPEVFHLEDTEDVKLVQDMHRLLNREELRQIRDMIQTRQDQIDLELNEFELTEAATMDGHL